MDGPPRRVSCEEDVCWVCLEGPSDNAGCLEHPCACPRGVHAKCLARWQLQSAGREEERYCRFCKSELPDWRDILTPKVPAAPPVMAIVYDGKVVRLQVKPGREGMLEFQRQVRRAFNLGDDVELDCVFDCRAPGTGEKIKLRGLESYSAAMHCASVAAGERIAKQQKANEQASGGGSSGGGSASPAAGGSGSSGGGSNGSSSGGGAAASPATSARRSAFASNPRTLPPPSPPPFTPRTPPTGANASAAAAALATARGSATPRVSSSESIESEQGAACHVPNVRTPRYGQDDSCGGGDDDLQTPPAEQSGGRRRNIFMGFLRGLGAVRRVL